MKEYRPVTASSTPGPEREELRIVQRAAARPGLSVPAKPPDFDQLYREYAPFVRSLARQLLGGVGDPDDVVQEVFFLAWKKRHEFRGCGARPWLGRLTVFAAAAIRRRLWWRKRLGLESPLLRRAAASASGHSPELSAEVREAFRIFNAVANGLPEKLRVTLILFELQGLTGEEIAELLGCSVSAVHTRLFRARRQFVAAFERAGFGDAPQGWR